MKRLITLLSLILVVLAGCSTKTTSTGGCSEDGALQVLSNLHVKSSDEAAAWSDYVSEQLGFDVELTYIEDEYDTYVKSAYSSDLCYDVIYTAQAFMMNDQYGLALDEYIKSSDVLSDQTIIPTSAYDAVKQFSDQEQIYGIPNKNEGNLVLTYREDWLKEFGMDEPTTLDGWRQYMEKANQEYGAYGFISTELYDIQPFMSANGVQYGLVQDNDGNWTVPYESDAAAEVYDWLGQLYDDGLYEPNMLTNGSDDMRNMMMSGGVATIGYWDTWVGLMNDQMVETDPDFKVIGAKTMVDENGNGYTRAGNPGAFIVNKNSQKIDKDIQFLEFMHSPEGDLLTSAGIPGVDYNMDGDELVFTEQGIDHGADHGVPRSLNENYEHPYSQFSLKGADESSAKVADYSFIATQAIDGVDYWTDIEEIINKYAIKSIIDPELTGQDAVEGMRTEIDPILADLNA